MRYQRRAAVPAWRAPASRCGVPQGDGASGLRARPRRHRRVPAREMRLLGLNANLADAAEVDAAQGGDVGDRVAHAGDELALGKYAVEPDQACFRGLATHLTPSFGNLGDASGKKRVRVAEHLCDGTEDLELHAALPHFNRAPCSCPRIHYAASSPETVRRYAT